MIDRDPRHDFDFLNGTWIITHRRLRDRLVGCTVWDEFTSHQEVRAIWGGRGQIDETWWDENGETVYGCTLRLYDPVADQWSMNWAASGTGKLFPPMVGRFRDGVGIFGGIDDVRGQTVLSRFTWYDISENVARWKQCFSNDGGQSWETNWYMDSRRATS